MRKITIVIIYLFLLINISVKKSLAASFNLIPNPPIDLSSYANKKITLIITGQNLFIPGKNYTLYQDPPDGDGPGKSLLNGQSPGNDPNLRLFEWNLDSGYQKLGRWQYEVCSGGRNLDTCVFSGSYEIATFQGGSPQIIPQQPAIYMIGQPARFDITKLKPNTTFTLWWEGDTSSRMTINTDGPYDVSSANPNLNQGSYTLCMAEGAHNNLFGVSCTYKSSSQVLFQLTPPPSGGGAGMSTCPTDPNKPTVLDGVPTALGCVATKPEDFVAQLLGWVIGLGGGIAFLLIVWGGFQIVTSSGDPEKLNSGKEIIVSALTGLLMIVFSVILLRIIGVDILKIPGF